MARSLLAALPLQCARCGRAGASPCGRCRSEFVFDRIPVERSSSVDGAAVALLRYDEASRPFVTAAKQRGAWASFAVLGPLMAERLSLALGPGALSESVVVTWAPTTRERRRRHGFDHAQLLARRVAGALGLRCVPLLRRVGQGRQEGRSAAERRRGPGFAPIGRIPRTVVLVDDVLTTGATLRAGSAALADGGAHVVHRLVLARAPLRT